MNIDFSKDMTYWLDLIREFLAVITDFFGDLGINIFKE